MQIQYCMEYVLPCPTFYFVFNVFCYMGALIYWCVSVIRIGFDCRRLRLHVSVISGVQMSLSAWQNPLSDKNEYRITG
jgi:hypothetical protein